MFNYLLLKNEMFLIFLIFDGFYSLIVYKIING